MTISEWPEGTEDLLARVGREDAQEIESACQLAMQGGAHGVLVMWRSWQSQRSWGDQEREIEFAAPDARVPYGQIYEVYADEDFDSGRLLE